VSFDDSLRHFMMGKLMAARGILGLRGWSEWFFAGYLFEHPVDPWFLSNVLYMPFTGFPIAQGLHLYALFSITFLAFCFVLILKNLEVNPVISSLLVLLLIFGHEGFLFRLLIARPFTVITALTVLLMLFIIKKKNIPAGITMVLLVMLSHIFVFPLGVALIGVFLSYMNKNKQKSLSLFAAVSVGTLVGFFLHPEPIEYLKYMGLVFFRTPFMNFPDRATELSGGLGEGGIIFVITAVIVLLHFLIIFNRKVRQKDLFVLLFLDFVAVFFLAQFMLWARSMDFLWPALLVLAGWLTTYFADPFGKLSELFSQKRHAIGALTAAFTLFVCFVSTVPLALAINFSDKNHSLNFYKQAFANVEPSARILPVRWDWFSPSVAVRPDLKYARGIDPLFDYASNSGAYALMAAVFPTRFPETRQYIDAEGWLEASLKVYPSDYLMLSAERYAPIIKSIKKLGYEDVSQSEKWAVFDVKKINGLGDKSKKSE